MKKLNDNTGVALVTTLMITLLSLVIVMGVLYVVAQGIKTGGSRKVYRNAVEASYGGANVAMYEIIPQLAAAILQDPTPTAAKTQTALDVLTSTTGLSGFGGSSKINLLFNSSADCLNQKLLNDSSGTNWNLCANSPTSVKSSDIKSGADITFELNGTSGSSFKVYSKIVDTIPGTAYMPAPPGGQPLLGGGAVDTVSGSVNLGKHFIYRIEVIGEKATNASEQGNLTVMYEY